jgi:DNA-binding transcriptional ArsR family regulator
VTRAEAAAGDGPTASSTREPLEVDASGLKALAHPLRMRMLDLLADEGPATASQLGAKVGESSGTTSYHLRLLATHGFIEEDPDRGNRRDRYWRTRPGGYNIDARRFVDDPSLAAEVTTVTAEIWRSYTESLRHWFLTGLSWGEPWVGSTTSNSARIEMTADEMAALRDEVIAVVNEHVERYRDREPPPGSARVMTQFHIYPLERLDDEQ